MRGVIFFPRRYHNFRIDRLEDFITQIAKAFGLQIILDPPYKVPKDLDLVILYGYPHHDPVRRNSFSEIMNLPKKTKVIGHSHDIHSPAAFVPDYKKMYDRIDMIMTTAPAYFEKCYPEYMHKVKRLPNYFGPQKRYIDLSYNEKPIYKCLVVGAKNPDVYPLRVFIRRNIKKAPIVISGANGDAYAKLLNNYFCCATCSSIYNYSVAKYHEIPAAGSLLIADPVIEALKEGLVPNKHFVPINRANAIATINDVCKNPNKYEHIRREGMEFVRANHGVNTRVKQYCEIIKDFMSKGVV